MRWHRIGDALWAAFAALARVTLQAINDTRTRAGQPTITGAQWRALIRSKMP